MGFARKHLAWLIMGVALLAEIVALWFVTGKHAEAESARENLERLREQRDVLKRQIFDIDERIKAHLERKELVRRELGDCALYLWHLGQSIEGLFDSKDLTPYNAHPWEAPESFEVFKIAYDRVYHREVRAIEPLMAKTGADPSVLGFADTGALAQVSVLIGDIFAMQKEFWVKKAIVQVLADSDAELVSITLGGAAASTRRLPPGLAPLAAGPGKLADELPILLSFSCNYLKLNDVLDALLAARLCLRIESVMKITRSKMVEAPIGAPTPTPVPAKGAPAAKAVEAVVAPERREYVTVEITGQIADLTMDVQEVVFPAPGFADRAKVTQWLDLQLRRAEARLKRYEVPDPAQRPEGGLPWVAQELQKVENAPPPAPGKALPPVEDELLGVKRGYVFTDVDAARQWLTHRYDFERAKVEAEAALWRRTRAILASGRSDDRTRVGVFVSPEGVTVGFRPANQFDPSQWYEADFDSGLPGVRGAPPAPVRVKLGLVVFKPRENHDVRRAVKAAGR